jgi:hypothetical protein
MLAVKEMLPTLANGQVQPAWTSAPVQSKCQPQPVTGSAATVLVVNQEENSPAIAAVFPALQLNCCTLLSAALWVTVQQKCGLLLPLPPVLLCAVHRCCTLPCAALWVTVHQMSA